MNMNPHPDWNVPVHWRQVRTPSTHGNPLPHWARWLAVALVVVGYALLEWHDAETEREIARADARSDVIAEARPQ